MTHSDYEKLKQRTHEALTKLNKVSLVKVRKEQSNYQTYVNVAIAPTEINAQGNRYGCLNSLSAELFVEVIEENIDFLVEQVKKKALTNLEEARKLALNNAVKFLEDELIDKIKDGDES